LIFILPQNEINEGFLRVIYYPHSTHFKTASRFGCFAAKLVRKIPEKFLPGFGEPEPLNPPLEGLIKKLI
jgi:hypothetical protein